MATEYRIYVGTYAKYNGGSIAGAWLDLEDYADKEDFLAACFDLHKDEEDPELMFQDWEGIPSALVGESWVSDDVWELMEADDQDAAFAYLECFGEWNKEDFEDRYRGQWDSWEDMAEELLEESGPLKPSLNTFVATSISRRMPVICALVARCANTTVTSSRITKGNTMAHSAKLEAFARQIGFYAFNRYARRQGLSLEATRAVIRNVF